MSTARAFGPRELGALRAALPVARELTGHYYALPDDWFEWASHEVCTVKDLRQGEVLGEGQLAQIRRLYRVLDEEPGRYRPCDCWCPHYRICLQDHNLLERVGRDRSLALPDLLTCVLTHEYVHLVRFLRFEHPYDAREELRAAEEARVEGITRTILHRLGHSSLRRAAAGT